MVGHVLLAKLSQGGATSQHKTKHRLQQGGPQLQAWPSPSRLPSPRCLHTHMFLSLSISCGIVSVCGSHRHAQRDEPHVQALALTHRAVLVCRS